MVDYKQIKNELSTTINTIWSNPRYRSDKKKMWRTVEAWKQIFELHRPENAWEENVLLAFQNAVTYRIYNMETADALAFIEYILEVMERVN